MRVSIVLGVLLSLVGSARADRFVMKDNSVRVGRLTGMEGSSFLVEVQGRVERLPAASVSLVMLEDAAAAPVNSAAPPRTSAPAGSASIFDGLDPVAPVVSQFSQTVDGVRVDLDRCTKQATKSVTCTLKVTNLQADRQIGMYANSGNRTYYIDDQGMQRGASSGRLGSTALGSYGETASVSEVSISASLDFPGVDPGVNLLAKLTITLYYPKEAVFEFRRVPLQGN